MTKILKKISLTAIILAFISHGWLMVAHAQEDTQDPSTETTQTDSSPSGQEDEERPEFTRGDSSSFPVTQYLTAKDQNQSYLKGENPVGKLIVQIINILVLSIGSLCFFSLVVGGFLLLISNGNENMVNKGKEIIQYALIGLVVVFSAYLIVAFAKSLFYELPGK
jgi:hypothetical protein